VRAVPVVAIVAVLLLGACGGDGDSNPSKTSSGTTQQATGSGANERSGDRARRRERASDRRRGELKRRQGQGAGSEGSGNVFFFKARSRCVTIPVEILARIYQAKSNDPRDVARAYADREAPTPIYKEAAIDGCLAGIDSRRER
jgi:hypothetical protein